jgi:hypothetical protein
MIVVNIVKIIIHTNVIKMTNITLYTKVNLLFLYNIELNTNNTQMKNLVFHNKCIYNYLYLSSTYSIIIYKY